METILSPVNPPLAVVPGFIATREIALILPRETIKVDSHGFNIVGLDKFPILQVDGKLSMHDKKSMLTPHETMLTLLAYTSPEGDPLFEVKYHHVKKQFQAKSLQDESKGAVLFIVDTIASATIHVGDTDTADKQRKAVDLLVEGNNVVLAKTKKPIAMVTPVPLADEALGKDDSYVVSIAAGVDYAVLPAICIALDELKKKSGTA